MMPSALHKREADSRVGRSQHSELSLQGSSVVALSHLVDLRGQVVVTTPFVWIEPRVSSRSTQGWQISPSNTTTPIVDALLSKLKLTNRAVVQEIKSLTVSNVKADHTAGPTKSVALSRLQNLSPSAAQRIEKLADLEWNWDGEEGDPITKQAMDLTADLVWQAISRDPSLPIPFIAPLPDGGLQIEWKSNVKAKLILVTTPEGNDTEYLLDVPRNSGGTDEHDGVVGLNGMSLDCLLGYLV